MRPALFALTLAGALAACGDDPSEDPLPPPAALGDAVVRFTIENGAGEEVSCASQNLTGFRVALGGVPEERVCGDLQEVSFEDLLPGRYPVIIELLASGDAVIRRHLGNVEVVDGEVTAYEHAFDIDGGNFGTGTVEIAWFVDGADAALGCALNDGDRVRIRLLDGPQEDLTLERGCQEGPLTIEEVRQGTYRIELELFDTAGERIGFPAIERQVRVDPNTTEQVFLDVVIALPSGGELLALWTVNSSVAPMGCDLVAQNEVEVSVRTDQSGGLTIATATAACHRGGLAFESLPTGRTREGAGLRITYELFDTSFGSRIVDTVVVRDVVLQPSRTSTVTGNFEVAGG